MAQIQTVIANLPSLIKDRADSAKFETAIRYLGDIIFDASQNPRGEKARWLARVLTTVSAGPEEVQIREAILTLFRDGYLERYADYSAWKLIGIAAAPSSVHPTKTDDSNSNATIGESPRIVALTQILNNPVPESRYSQAELISSAAKEGVKPSTGAPTTNEVVPPSMPEGKTVSNRAEAGQVGELREVRKPVHLPLSTANSDPKIEEPRNTATTSLEIASLQDSARNPFGFAKSFKKIAEYKVSGQLFSCLAGFKPEVRDDKGFVEWTNPITGDRFRDHGRKLTSDSPSRLAMRAMLELARAANWTKVSVMGSVRLRTFAEAVATELESVIPGRPELQRSPKPGPPLGQKQPPFSYGPADTGAGSKRRTLRMTAWSAFLCLLFCLAGFVGAYVWMVPEAPMALRAERLLNALPWRISKRVAARKHPLHLLSLSLTILGNNGTRIVSSKDTFRVRNGEYLSWTAKFNNELSGLEDHDERVSASLLDPYGGVIGTSSDEQIVTLKEQTATFSGVTVSISGRPPGVYRVTLSRGTERVGEQEFIVIESPRWPKARLTPLSAPTPSVTITGKSGPEGRRSQQEGGPYRIQIEDMADYQSAQMIMQRLRRLGYVPEMTTIMDLGQTSYRIEIGGFASQEDAEAAQDELNDKYNAELKAEHPELLKRAAKAHPEHATELASREPAVEKPPVAPVILQQPSPPRTSHATPTGGIEFGSEPQKPGVNPSRYAAASYYDQGNDLLAKNNLVEASSHFQRAVALDPTNADAFYAWGLTLYTQDDLDGAIAKFRRAISLKPNYAKAYYNWGLALSRRGDFENAIPTFEQATRLKPDYADAFYGWGVALYHQHKLEDSVAKYRKALELRPKNDTYREALDSALAAERYFGATSRH